MTSWSEYVIAAVVLQNPELYTLPMGLRSFQASLATQWGLYAAGALIVSIPVLILFISISRYLVSGLTMGSVKG
ncbi:L-arabinose transport system permease protein AraQ [compost metagenome]